MSPPALLSATHSVCFAAASLATAAARRDIYVQVDEIIHGPPAFFHRFRMTPHTDPNSTTPRRYVHNARRPHKTRRRGMYTGGGPQTRARPVARPSSVFQLIAQANGDCLSCS
jgi:hypothetical protein